MNWIPVEERLPSTGETVYATTSDGRLCEAYMGITTGKWYLKDMTGLSLDVIAWQPIIRPEPYVKPRRFVVRCYGEFYRVQKSHPSCKALAFAIPTREAAQRIADIYEEVYK